jgi:prepilin-type N-terminal cleavage/methylation domain-containing protein
MIDENGSEHEAKGSLCRKAVPRPRKSTWMSLTDRGLTLLELMVAIVLLGIISTMIYSVLNVGIKFSDKGEKAIQESARKNGILNLLHRQVTTAYYDTIRKKVMVSGDGEVLRVVTRSPLRYRNSGVVLAIYRYDQAEQILYYTEKRDYYNLDYDEEYLPDYDQMLVLSSEVPAVSFKVDEETQMVTFDYGEEEITIQPRCADILAAGGEGLIP